MLLGYGVISNSARSHPVQSEKSALPHVWDDGVAITEPSARWMLFLSTRSAETWLVSLPPTRTLAEATSRFGAVAAALVRNA